MSPADVRLTNRYLNRYWLFAAINVAATISAWLGVIGHDIPRALLIGVTTAVLVATFRDRVAIARWMRTRFVMLPFSAPTDPVLNLITIFEIAVAIYLFSLPA